MIIIELGFPCGYGGWSEWQIRLVAWVKFAVMIFYAESSVRPLALTFLFTTDDHVNQPSHTFHYPCNKAGNDEKRTRRTMDTRRKSTEREELGLRDEGSALPDGPITVTG